MNRRWLATGVLAWLLGATALPAAESAPKPLTAEQTDFFEKKVRPLLVEHCHKCHGPVKSKAGLRLDSRKAILEGGDQGPALVPGNPDASILIQAIRYEGDNAKNPRLPNMPPKAKLDAKAIEALTTWVKIGAPYPESRTVLDQPRWQKHWAFQPVANAPLPAVKQGTRPKTTVDYFILAKLEEKGLAPTAQANRRTLLRRASFDLIGLPPTPEEIASFENDPAPEAFARAVDRLLASPHYGERWGRHWLDVARFADTKGYVFFQDTNYPWAHTYRDYVIRAFNEDLPYDQFILHQLAADKLPLGADQRPLAAMGFLTIGGRFMNNVQDTLDDRIDVVTRGLLGLTVTCARCHDHKFDPIPTKEYYSLYGVFAGSIEPEVPPLFEPAPTTAAYAAFQKELATKEKKLEEFRLGKFNDLVSKARMRAGEYIHAAQHALNHPNPEEFMLIADGNDLNPTMIARWRAFLGRTKIKHDPAMAPWHALAALPEKDFAARAKDLIGNWAFQPDPARPLNPLIVFALASRPPGSLPDAAGRYGDVLNQVEALWQEAERRGLKKLPDAAQEQLRQVFHGPAAAPNLQRGLISDLQLLPDRASQGKLQELDKAVEQYRINGPGAPPRAHTLVDAPTPYQARVFLRGNPNQLGEAVVRQMPAVAAGTKPIPFRNGSGRLELAQAIVDRANPLTARVFVNRVWMHHFGTGLVRTPSDFGLRSEPPSHPELLDHLARSFMEKGWSVKQLHRLIVLSATYQQKSDDRTEAAKVDPENVFLWRQNRRRLDFEATRDNLLAVSGKLDRTVGGKSIRDSLTPTANRRTLYAYIDRQYTPNLFRAFDFPSPDTLSPQRDTTTIPQQALFMMNNPFVMENTKALLRRPDVAAAKDDVAKIDRLHRLCYGRPPAAEDIALARAFLADGKPATWERYVQALLAANEFVFVD